MADDFTFSTQVAPEVLAYFDAKNLRPSFSWLDVWGEEHAHAFTVAKAMEVDVLDTIKAEIRKSLADGETFETFRDNLEPKLRALGWWGRREMVNPDTGEAEEVQLGSPRRLRVIYQANVRSARACRAVGTDTADKGIIAISTISSRAFGKAPAAPCGQGGPRSDS